MVSSSGVITFMRASSLPLNKRVFRRDVRYYPLP